MADTGETKHDLNLQTATLPFQLGRPSSRLGFKSLRHPRPHCLGSLGRDQPEAGRILGDREAVAGLSRASTRRPLVARIAAAIATTSPLPPVCGEL